MMQVCKTKRISERTFFKKIKVAGKRQQLYNINKTEIVLNQELKQT